LDELSGRAGRAATFDSHNRSIAAIPRFYYKLSTILTIS
jgi:hypothetical protein